MAANPPVSPPPSSGNPIRRIYDFWIGIPPEIREPIKSGVVSLSWSLQNILVALYGGYVQFADTLHQPVTFAGFCAFVGATWFTTASGLISAIYRAKQGLTAVQNTEVLPDGRTVVVVKGAPAGATDAPAKP
jgi:hypothetical protein